MAGARFVVRHNTIFKNGVIANHGTESTGRVRGGRAMEVYGNIFTGTDLNRFVGGVRVQAEVLFHDNTISGYWGRIWRPLRWITLRDNFYPFSPWADMTEQTHGT